MAKQFAFRVFRSNAVTDIDGNEHGGRIRWNSPLEFVLSLISNSVGLGNVWRFPYLAAKSGGGAFLIPYFILYFAIGAPLYYLELAVGQFTSRGPGKAFGFARGWRGIGYAMIANSTFCILYYNVIISWAIFYFVASIRTTLLWKTCTNSWNDRNCFVPGDNDSSFIMNDTWFNSSGPSDRRATSAEQLFFGYLLGKSKGFHDFGTPQMYSSLCLLGAWFLVAVSIIRGVKLSGRIAYFTAIFPYIVLLILIIQSATLDGALDGVVFYVKPRWELLGDFETWKAAASQVFFSLGVGFGSLVAYSSSNEFKNNFFKQMCVVVACDCLTGVFAGFAVFSTIGYLAKQLNETVDGYAESSGPGLAFITYPEALAKMPGSSFFSIIFFLMLVTLGLGSQFALTDVTITSFIEFFPQYRISRRMATIIVCTISFLISLPFTCPGGIYLFELFSEYTANISLLVVGFFEVFIVTYVYGFNRFLEDVRMMLGKRAAEYYLFITWAIVAPVFIMVIVVLNLINSKPLSSGAGAGFDAYNFPTWSTAIGWLLFIFCIIYIPLVFIITCIQDYLSTPKQIGVESVNDPEQIYMPRYLRALKTANSIGADWGPFDPKDRSGLYTSQNKLVTKEIPLEEMVPPSLADETTDF